MYASSRLRVIARNNFLDYSTADFSSYGIKRTLFRRMLTFRFVGEPFEVFWGLKPLPLPHLLHQ